MISRENAFALLKKHVRTKNLIKHCLATEAVMRALAREFNEDEEKWGIAGLLHDLDYDYTKDNPDEHGLKTLEILKEEDVPEDVLNAILAHCGKKEPETLMEKALYAVDPVTGFIVAAALIRPEKKLEVLDVDFLMRRFKEKAFARGASREQIRSCEKLGLSLERFLGISLEAMKSIASDLGL
ncbi:MULTISPECIES: HD domain-containing protein [Thermotoga]|uniref:Metal dependent phosphohydrolase n=1 Tax=Thermotoga neapolitana (strain ATCC 49049 / DSM 4359 / NBRC 107923 / NS-E) TaxID=309803 RepID=B9K8N4_THENN|nr:MULTISPECIES: HD domain-containing protein [Thermotoga]ACM23317.1 Metal dependent phosphohydrolase [Thermotoga neapolitana DSM 4359]AJG41232.1 phosphohydrolase [Thermotoga sp. RQ7]KFZ21587.1 Metal dependent phosphohydrolase [Thermotoga neapolitana LA10]HBF11383.1 HDIG domain-containing protein [Thermotoga neapolitana]